MYLVGLKALVVELRLPAVAAVLHAGAEEGDSLSRSVLQPGECLEVSVQVVADRVVVAGIDTHEIGIADTTQLRPAGIVSKHLIGFRDSRRNVHEHRPVQAVQELRE